MSEVEGVTDQAHLSIGEVLSLLQAEFPDVTISKIRFLESQGLLDPERTPSGYRKFYESDIEQLRWILTQQKDHFLPLKVIKDRLDERADFEGNGDDDRSASTATAAAGAEGPIHKDPTSSEEPVWMADAARAAAARSVEVGPSLFDRSEVSSKAQPSPAADMAGASKAAESGEAPRSGPVRTTPLDAGPTSVSLTFSELAAAAKVTEPELRELEGFGLIQGRSVGTEVFYDGDALVVAQTAASFTARGIEPRHLRMFKVAAEREAGFLEQVVMPMVKQRNPAARSQAVTTLGELAALGQSMRAALLRNALRDYLG